MPNKMDKVELSICRVSIRFFTQCCVEQGRLQSAVTKSDLERQAVLALSASPIILMCLGIMLIRYAGFAMVTERCAKNASH